MVYVLFMLDFIQKSLFNLILRYFDRNLFAWWFLLMLITTNEARVGQRVKERERNVFMLQKKHSLSEKVFFLL